MEVNKIYQGKALDLIKQLPDNSIDCVITSPPYWQLRDYGWDGQWGLEPTFQEYLQHLWQLMAEIRRVSKDEGTCWINIGDTYSGDKTGNDDPKLHDAIKKSEVKKRVQSVRNKSLCLIPHRFAIGCIDAGWICRNDIIWAKRNGMPESVTDRFSKKHEYFFLMVKNEQYYFDLDGIRDKSVTPNKLRNKSNEDYANGFISPLGKGLRPEQHPLGKNPGSVADFWDIPTQPSSDQHYAAYNDDLIGKPIISGCPKGGIILDPFCGTATTGCRAVDLGRKFIGFEGKEEYVKIGNKKLHPYLITQQLF